MTSHTLKSSQTFVSPLKIIQTRLIISQSHMQLRVRYLGHQRTCIDKIVSSSIKCHQMGSSAIPWTCMDINGHASMILYRLSITFYLMGSSASYLGIRRDSSLREHAVKIVEHVTGFVISWTDFKCDCVVVAQECGELVRLVVDAGCGRGAIKNAPHSRLNSCWG